MRTESNGPRKTRRVSVKRHPGVYYREGADGRRRYEISYYDSTGKRRWETVAGNLEDADAALADRRSRMRGGTCSAANSLRPTCTATASASSTCGTGSRRGSKWI